MDIVDQTAERLTRLRVQAGLDLESAAAGAGIDVERLGEAEGGELVLTDEELSASAKAYGVDPTEIFGGRITPFRDYAAGA